MTPELFAKLKDVKSSKGYTLSNGMQAGTSLFFFLITLQPRDE